MLENYGDILNVKDVSEILKIDKKTTYQLLKSEALSCRRIGRIYRISKESLIKLRKTSHKRFKKSQKLKNLHIVYNTVFNITYSRKTATGKPKIGV